MKSESKIASLNILSTALIAGINFITIPIFTRMLDTTGYGIVSIYTAWVQIFVVIIGLKVDGTIGSAQANLPKTEQDRYQVSILLLTIPLFGVLFTLCLLFLKQISNLLLLDGKVVIALMLQSYGSFIISFFSMRFIFRKEACKNFFLSVGICGLTTALSIILIFFVFRSPDAYLGRVFGLMIPNFAIGILLLSWLLAKVGRGPRTIDLKFCLPLALPLVFHGLSQLALSQTGKIMVQQQLGDSLAGIYGLAITIVTLMASIYSALNNAFVPFMYEDLAGETGEDVKQRHFSNYVSLFSFGSCAFCLVSPEILMFMSTPAYWVGVDLLPLLVVGQYCVFLYSFPVNYEFFKMKTGSIAVGTLFAAVLNIALTLVLIPPLGIMGAALSTMIAYLALFLFHFFMARYRLGDRNYPARFLFAGLIAIVLVAICCYATMDIPVIRWVIGLSLLGASGLRIWRNKTIF